MLSSVYRDDDQASGNELKIFAFRLITNFLSHSKIYLYPPDNDTLRNFNLKSALLKIMSHTYIATF